MPRKPHPFTQIGLKRSLRKFSVAEKREIIRKYLFGDNQYRYPTGKKGESFNEFELDQIIVFLSSTHIDNYVPSTFKKRGSSTTPERKGSSQFQLSDDRSGDAEGRRGIMEDNLDIDSVLSELNDELDGGDSSEEDR